ncbi:MAG: 30S ribosomal protein S16 [Deltaproteobacteria bacterium RBG_19FT_COMBO_46_9]|nr:MAG: 30S ribosomal protein S16 [Deltaproteobacteria bacterium RBG_19FT_COMBO_46_9]
MAVRLRLTRKGANKRPHYRLVAADSKASRDGKFLEILGTYNPMRNPVEIKIDKDRVNYWLEKGASPSESVRAILTKEGLLKVPTTTN